MLTQRIFHDNGWIILEGMRQPPDLLAALPRQSITLATCFAADTLATIPSLGGALVLPRA